MKPVPVTPQPVEKLPETFITFLTELAIGFSVVHPKPPEDPLPPLDSSRNQALT
jgi:hypothetical protein